MRRKRGGTRHAQDYHYRLRAVLRARFEVDAGSTNRSNVRLEGSAVFGTERQAATVRIAAS